MNKFDENCIVEMNKMIDNIPILSLNGNRELTKIIVNLSFSSNPRHEIEFDGLTYFFEKGYCVGIKRNILYYFKKISWHYK